MLLASSRWRLLVVSVLVIVAVGLAVFVLVRKSQPNGETIVEEETPSSRHELIGKSVEGRPIESYNYGTGDTRLLFVGGVHGGYEWNSVYLAYRFIDYLESNQDIIPDTLTISVIPSANPDGLFKVVGSGGRFTVDDVPDTDQSVGRFNAHGVDLNRNFDCKWKPESTWRGNVVSAGTSAFSEPETQAIRDFVVKNKPSAVVFWHSQANAVYASECENGILPETLAIMDAYSRASGYPAVSSFDQYEITGDAEGWLASIGIPAITVELSSHDFIEWDKNIAGAEALLGHYGR